MMGNKMNYNLCLQKTKAIKYRFGNDVTYESTFLMFSKLFKITMKNWIHAIFFYPNAY